MFLADLQFESVWLCRYTSEAALRFHCWRFSVSRGVVRALVLYLDIDLTTEGTLLENVEDQVYLQPLLHSLWLLQAQRVSFWV